MQIPSDVKDALMLRGYSEEAIKSMSGKTIFREYCEWEGLIGWGNRLWVLAHFLGDDS